MTKIETSLFFPSDSKLTWKPQLTSERNNIKKKLRQMNWLLRRNSKLKTENKMILYALLKKYEHTDQAFYFKNY